MWVDQGGVVEIISLGAGRRALSWPSRGRPAQPKRCHAGRQDRGWIISLLPVMKQVASTSVPPLLRFGPYDRPAEDAALLLLRRDRLGDRRRHLPVLAEPLLRRPARRAHGKPGAVLITSFLLKKFSTYCSARRRPRDHVQRQRDYATPVLSACGAVSLDASFTGPSSSGPNRKHGTPASGRGTAAGIPNWRFGPRTGPLAAARPSAAAARPPGPSPRRAASGRRCRPLTPSSPAAAPPPPAGPCIDTHNVTQHTHTTQK